MEQHVHVNLQDACCYTRGLDESWGVFWGPLLLLPSNLALTFIGPWIGCRQSQCMLYGHWLRVRRSLRIIIIIIGCKTMNCHQVKKPIAHVVLACYACLTIPSSIAYLHQKRSTLYHISMISFNYLNAFLTSANTCQPKWWQIVSDDWSWAQNHSV